ncbi:hypothetical protein AB6A40_003246 [Gnathostoma spinigerum]|uniref:Uncharacterized protein n=1 Tax=Gnathostoma spinigerum TaxID=75299 RepID=A0ABD6EIY9_9BILA
MGLFSMIGRNSAEKVPKKAKQGNERATSPVDKASHSKATVNSSDPGTEVKKRNAPLPPKSVAPPPPTAERDEEFANSVYRVMPSASRIIDNISPEPNKLSQNEHPLDISPVLRTPRSVKRNDHAKKQLENNEAATTGRSKSFDDEQQRSTRANSTSSYSSRGDPTDVVTKTVAQDIIHYGDQYENNPSINRNADTRIIGATRSQGMKVSSFEEEKITEGIIQDEFNKLKELFQRSNAEEYSLAERQAIQDDILRQLDSIQQRCIGKESPVGFKAFLQETSKTRAASKMASPTPNTKVSKFTIDESGNWIRREAGSEIDNKRRSVVPEQRVNKWIADGMRISKSSEYLNGIARGTQNSTRENIHPNMSNISLGLGGQTVTNKPNMDRKWISQTVRERSMSNDAEREFAKQRLMAEVVADAKRQDEYKKSRERLTTPNEGNEQSQNTMPTADHRSPPNTLPRFTGNRISRFTPVETFDIAPIKSKTHLVPKSSKFDKLKQNWNNEPVQNEVNHSEWRTTTHTDAVTSKRPQVNSSSEIPGKKDSNRILPGGKTWKTSSETMQNELSSVQKLPTSKYAFDEKPVRNNWRSGFENDDVIRNRNSYVRENSANQRSANNPRSPVVAENVSEDENTVDNIKRANGDDYLNDEDLEDLPELNGGAFTSTAKMKLLQELQKRQGKIASLSKRQPQTHNIRLLAKNQMQDTLEEESPLKNQLVSKQEPPHSLRDIIKDSATRWNDEQIEIDRMATENDDYEPTKSVGSLNRDSRQFEMDLLRAQATVMDDWGCVGEKDLFHSFGANKSLDELVESLDFSSKISDLSFSQSFPISNGITQSVQVVPFIVSTSPPNGCAPKILKKRTVNKGDEDSRSVLKRVTFDVEKFVADESEDSAERENARARLAMQLGARSPTRKYENYKVLKERLKSEKETPFKDDKTSALATLKNPLLKSKKKKKGKLAKKKR